MQVAQLLDYTIDETAVPSIHKMARITDLPPREHQTYHPGQHHSRLERPFEFFWVARLHPGSRAYDQRGGETSSLPQQSQKRDPTCHAFRLKGRKEGRHEKSKASQYQWQDPRVD